MEITKGYYKHNRTGKRIYIDTVLNHLDWKTGEEYRVCHCHVIRSQFDGYWKYVKESIIARDYTRVDISDMILPIDN
jgi:hypothetical protein